MSAGGALELLDDDARDRLRARDHPRSVEPALARLYDDPPPSDQDWLFERKLDGVRLLAHRDGDEVRLLTRNGKRRDDHFPELVDALRDVGPDDVVLDGEVVAFDGDRTSFQRLQGRMGIADPQRARGTGIAVYLYLFDVLHLDGFDTTRLTLRDRKRVLKAAIEYADPLRFTPHRVGDGAERLAEACERGWEGLIAKRAASRYPGGRSSDWRKLKCVARQELVVGGWTDPRGSRTGFGALLVGYHDDGELVYAGKVGTGYDEDTLERLGDHLREIERDDPPFADPPSGSDLHWVEPNLVAEIGFTEWTRDGKLRHPTFTGLRTDKEPEDVVREAPS